MATDSSKGQVRIGQLEGEIWLVVQGSGTHRTSPALRECLQRLLEQGCRRFYLDLGECTHMDSTFMGVLASACMRLRALTGGRMVLGRAGERNLQLLKTLGVDRFFELAPSCACRTQTECLPEPADAQHAWRQTVLDAHLALAAAEPANAQRFKDVLQFLEEDLGRTQPG